MKIIRRGLLITAIVILLLLAIENALAFWLMLELGVPRALWFASIEFSIFAFLAVALIWRGRLWFRR